MAMVPAFGVRASEAPKPPARPPNIVYVFADQMRACARGGADGADPVLTPRLDQFAREGLELTQAASTYPLCSPHRAMLLSGCYPHINTVTGNINSAPNRKFELPDTMTCVTDVLAGSGYSVGYIGKWHLTRPYEPYLEAFRKKDGVVWNEFTPPSGRHGISEWYAYNTYDKHLRPMYWSNDASRDDYHFVDQWGPDHETDKAVEYLRTHQASDQPFALFVSYNPPHPPFGQVPENWVDLYRDASATELLRRGNVPEGGRLPLRQAQGYFGMVSGVDAAFGRLLDEIDALGLREDTLVVFTSDHGEMMGSHDLMSKLVWYDESYRVPFIARWPGRLKAGAQDSLLIDTPDIPATLVGMAGLEGRIPAHWQGRNHAPVLLGQSDAPRPEAQLYCLNSHGLRGVRTDRYTYVAPGRARTKIGGQVMDAPLLFDNQEDPWQLHNVAADQPAVVDELTGVTLDACRRIRDPWTPFVRG
ncbi:sulfatase [Ruficoccus sp. ZRK36]|uniref:sulfatase family protein n=1 Tax=Ruficoccus sp. ZRK36 TaxID=2866311 RepID=UPI001C73A63E|nr:sulfatase [Ruficoccus sp. ZRK36]QYY35078.1 sulfatase [Ruficoccus sp. ZRK36]